MNTDIFKDEITIDWLTGGQNIFKKLTGKQKSENEKKIILTLMEKYGYEFKSDKNQKKSNWNTLFSEELVKLYLCKCYDSKYVINQPSIKINGKTYKPDFKLDVNDNKVIIDVKCQSYTISGTANEKIIGTIYKYLPILDTFQDINHMQIILVGNMELLNDNLINPKYKSQIDMIEFLKTKKITIVRFSDLLKSNSILSPP